jgi:hypothetical protein
MEPVSVEVGRLRWDTLLFAIHLPIAAGPDVPLKPGWTIESASD